MTPSDKKQKGRELEKYIADQIVLKGLDPKARHDGASGAGNREKADISTSLLILGRQAGIEAKNQKTLSIPEWWRQTKKLENLGQEPVLAFKIHGDSLEDTKVIIYLDTFLEILKNQRGFIEREFTQTKTIEKERAIEQIISASKILERL